MKDTKMGTLFQARLSRGGEIIKKEKEIAVDVFLSHNPGNLKWMQSVLLFLYFLFIDGNSAKSQEKVNGKKDHLFLPTGLLSILKIGSLETFQGRRENIHVPTHQSVSKD